jgi:hypothetical protein
MMPDSADGANKAKARIEAYQRLAARAGAGGELGETVADLLTLLDVRLVGQPGPELPGEGPQ